MHTAQTGQIQKTMPKAIIDGIVGGSIIIDSPEAFSYIIEHFPENPDLLCMYARLLMKNNGNVSAIGLYERAANIYSDSGEIIQAIISKANKWRMSRPDIEEIDRFFCSIEKASQQHQPFSEFFNQLSRSEKMALMFSLEYIVFPAKTIVVKPGIIEDAIYFVVSGELKESFYRLIDHKEKYPTQPVQKIQKNGHFGNIYPYIKEIKAQSIVETLSVVQLAKLSKKNLTIICNKFPHIEKEFIGLCDIRSNSEMPGSEIKIRKSYRYPIQVNMKVDILASEKDEPEYSFFGYSKDLSVTGVGFMINACSKELKEKLAAIFERDQKRKVVSIFYGENISITISGEIVRFQEIIENGARTVMLGIQFESMPPNIQGLLFSAARIFSSSESPPLQ
jgi:hypothetical protein